MSREPVQLLEFALRTQFGKVDAHFLSLLLLPCLEVETMSYGEISLPRDQKNEYILMAFEERLLIPVQDKRGIGWDDCGLRIEDKESYCMPCLCRDILKMALSSGKLDSEQAVRNILAKDAQRDCEQIFGFLCILKRHAQSLRFEAGLLPVIIQSMDFKEDMHALIDFLVLLGIISPSKTSSMAKGLAWFEINPCLYWGNAW
jgi:hypothetical protein